MLIFSPKNGSSSLATISVQTVVPAPGFCGTTNVTSANAVVANAAIAVAVYNVFLNKVYFPFVVKYAINKY